MLRLVRRPLGKLKQANQYLDSGCFQTLAISKDFTENIHRCLGRFLRLCCVLLPLKQPITRSVIATEGSNPSLTAPGKFADSDKFPTRTFEANFFAPPDCGARETQNREAAPGNLIHARHPSDAYLVLCGTADWWGWSLNSGDVTCPACLAKLEGRVAR